jgi:excisionase family DNA binding protein
MARDLNNDDLLSLSEAAELLGVHPATLRRWSDKGDVLVIMTPGGHRRFPATEIERLRGASGGLASPASASDHLVQTAIDSAREEISHGPPGQWHSRIDAATRERHRELGLQIMEVLRSYLKAEPEAEAGLLADARQIATRYAGIASTMGLERADVLKAILFFRDHIVESAFAMPELSSLDEVKHHAFLRRVNTFLNDVLLRVTEEFDQQHPGTNN